MNNIKTELDFNTEMDDPDFTRRFFREISLCIGIAIVIVVAIILILLNGEFIDSVKPETQLTIFAVACAAFGTLRFVIWIRQKI